MNGAIEIGICEPPTPDTSIRICAWESSERVVTPIAKKMLRETLIARTTMLQKPGLASILKAEGEGKAAATSVLEVRSA